MIQTTSDNLDALGPALAADCRLFASLPAVPLCPEAAAPPV